MAEKEKMFRCEYNPGEGFFLRFNPSEFNILPSATRGHLRAAQREMLLALRSMLDVAIDRTERAEAAKRKPTRIEVQ